MLVITVQPKKEKVTIIDSKTGEPIVDVFVSEIRGDRVRLSFEADLRWRILREESYVDDEIDSGASSSD